MKFVLKHRSDILMALKQHGILESEVNFVKKRGRIHVLHLASGNNFSYLRKKETRLDPHDHQWSHREWFKIKSSGETEVDVADWEQVVHAFNNWLSQVLP